MQESLSGPLSIIAPVGHCIVHSSTYVATHHLSGRPAAIMSCYFALRQCFVKGTRVGGGTDRQAALACIC